MADTTPTPPVHHERPRLADPAALSPAHSPENWPIAAAMLQFPALDADGTPVSELVPERWRRLLQPVVDAGFAQLELSTSWMPFGELPPDRLTALGEVLADAGLSVPGICVVRQSVIHPERGERNLAVTHRAIDAAAGLGAGIVCLGLHDALTPEQRRALWFWTAPQDERYADPEVYRLAVRRFRELGDHARSAGVELSLELYENTYLGSADEAARFLDDIGHDAVGLNPDLGNLLRQQRPTDSWEYLMSVAAPRANYWHVKNYLRLEDPGTGTVLTHPTSLELGIVNYRAAVRHAIAHGFRGAFVVEHYGGDGLGDGTTNADYLRRILPREESR
ncbi:sugar phosphate isomerase/epimerase [Saccharopolyspora sp. 6T]|uniref:sugar phosphate isomerase/epimerase family protein n=1 Tax=Saccharopolyspora sp. 6T TaxID=2877238 RepID=UPI001CD303D0|nr:sugar phosphate isomerase/epimerase family protein [Saccharopolyspora sp. 6T]MCA1187347.1 sugar phosphate isomerase/epimerase [Saccharopolyspora sp. 6T]